MNTGNDSPQRHGDPAQAPSSWWIAMLGHTLHWALLRERESGTAEVLDHDGNLHAYDSIDTARSMLLDAGYVEFDGLSLDELAPPRASSDAGLVGLMSVTLGRRA